MLEIKAVTITCMDKSGWGYEKDLVRYTNTDNGKTSYLHDYEYLSTRDELNYLYKKGKAECEMFKAETKEETKDLNEYIAYCRKNIDPYAGYIENGSQYKSVCERNKTYKAILKALEEIC